MRYRIEEATKRVLAYVRDESEAIKQVKEHLRGSYKGDVHLTIEHVSVQPVRNEAIDALFRWLEADGPKQVHYTHPLVDWGIFARDASKSFYSVSATYYLSVEIPDDAEASDAPVAGEPGVSMAGNSEVAIS